MQDHSFQNDDIKGKKTSFLKRVFRPRDILIRSQGRVNFINLSPRLQIALCCSVSAFAIWLVGSTGVSLWQSSVINERNIVIAEAKLSQERVHSDFITYKNELERISLILSTSQLDDGNVSSSNNLSLSEEMVSFRLLGEKVQNSLARASIDYNVESEDKDIIVKSRDGLHDKIIKLKAELASRDTDIQNKLKQLASLSDQLKQEDIRYQELEGSRNNLGRKVKDLTLALSEAQDYNSKANNNIEFFSKSLDDLEKIKVSLSEENLGLKSALEETQQSKREVEIIKKQAEERVALLNRRFDNLLSDTTGEETVVADLSNEPLPNRLSVLEETSSLMMSNLVEYRDMSDTVEKTLDGVVEGLSRVTGYTGDQGAEDRANRPAQALTLLSKLENIHDGQLNVVSNLLERTEKAISHKQATLSSTGINLQKALEMAGLYEGQGGPLNEMPDFTGGSSADLDGTVASLEQKMLKLQALDKLVACVPLVSPVDYYHLTSKYGKRKDPFTGKNAMHKGVDLGGWPGTLVHATASGKVVHAGNSNKYGKMVEIDHGCGIVTRYGHLRKVLVKKGDEVSHRSKIGKLGSTGRSTGPHVHYEIRVDDKPVDPMNFLEAGRLVYKG